MFIVKFLGGIGNQLYQLNFIYYLQNKFPKSKILVDYSYYNFDSIHGGFMLDNINLPDIKKYISSFYRYIDDSSYKEDFNESDNIIFEGYWQNTRFLDKIYFTFNDVFHSNINTESQRYYDEIKETENSVSIHVRCGDYDNHPHFGNISTKAYYNNAIKKICTDIPNPVFYVFSNNITWSKENLKFDNHKVVYVTCNTNPEDAKWDLFLMSSCKHNIISNSSFSWWAQRFNRNINKLVITPPYWVNENSACFKQNIPDIQSFPYMKKVSNLPVDKLKIFNDLSILILLRNDIQDYYKLHRIISTILNQCEQIPNLLIYSFYDNELLNEYINSISKLCKITIIYGKEKNLSELKNIIKTKYILCTNVNYFFNNNFYSILKSLKLYENNTSIINFYDSDNEMIKIDDIERKLNSLYISDIFFENFDVDCNSQISIDEQIVLFNNKNNENFKKEKFIKKILKYIIKKICKIK